MDIGHLIKSFSDTREHQAKAVFSTLFIAENRLRTIFDRQSGDVTLKQFMLLTIVRQAKEPLSLTNAGKLLGCSRQNVKQLADALERKGYVEVLPSASDVRAASILAKPRLEEYFQSISKAHEAALKELFCVYQDEEVAQLFRLMMKLYDGIDLLENVGETEREL